METCITETFFSCLQKETPALGEEIDSDSSSRLSYASVHRDGVEYSVGDCCYISPEAYSFSVKPAAAKKQKTDKRLVSDPFQIL